MINYSRRDFFKLSAVTAINITVLNKLSKYDSHILFDDDEKLCSKKFELLIASNVSSLPIGEAIAEVGKSFAGTAYVAGTLEKNIKNESLIVNLKGLDCVTFVENCLVFARCLKKGKTSFSDYIEELQKIRYRDGIIDGYPSRLHYFADWINDNEKKGIVKDITSEIGGVKYEKNINFMSNHASSYKQLADKDNLNRIYEIENVINSRLIYYIPKNEIKSAYDSLQSGDIIATTTSIPGLDVTHTGYVYKSGNEVYFMHASSKSKKVVISDNYLADYIYEDSKKTGIIVARPIEV